MTPHLTPDEISAHLNDELVGEGLSRVEGHLAICPACTRERTAWQKTINLLGSLPKVSAPQDLWAGIQTRLHTPREPGVWEAVRAGWLALGAAWQRPATWGGLAAAAAVVMILVTQREEGFSTNPRDIAPSVKSERQMGKEQGGDLTEASQRGKNILQDQDNSVKGGEKYDEKDQQRRKSSTPSTAGSVSVEDEFLDNNGRDRGVSSNLHVRPMDRPDAGTAERSKQAPQGPLKLLKEGNANKLLKGKLVLDKGAINSVGAKKTSGLLKIDGRGGSSFRDRSKLPDKIPPPEPPTGSGSFVGTIRSGARQPQTPEAPPLPIEGNQTGGALSALPGKDRLQAGPKVNQPPHPAAGIGDISLLPVHPESGSVRGDQNDEEAAKRHVLEEKSKLEASELFTATAQRALAVSFSAGSAQSDAMPVYVMESASIHLKYQDVVKSLTAISGVLVEDALAAGFGGWVPGVIYKVVADGVESEAPIVCVITVSPEAFPQVERQLKAMGGTIEVAGSETVSLFTASRLVGHGETLPAVFSTPNGLKVTLARAGLDLKARQKEPVKLVRIIIRSPEKKTPSK